MKHAHGTLRSGPGRAFLAAVLVSAAAAFSSSACKGASGTASAAGLGQTTPAPVGDAKAAVAKVDDAVITQADLDARVESRLARLRQEEYEIRKQALDEIVDERLLDREAKKRGISKEDLLKDEVERQAQKPTAADIDAVYNQYKSRLGGRTREQAGPEIERMLIERAQQTRREAFVQRLRSAAKVTIALDAPRTAVPIPASAPVLGPSNAPVTIVEFADYQCPYCHRAQDTVDLVMSRYAGKVQLVHRDFPLDGHPGAYPAARAARCAGEQGKFWDYHRSLMKEQGDLSESDLLARAKTLKLELDPFKTCIASDRYDSAIRESVEAGSRAGVSGTPAFFVNGRMMTGARPFEQFQEVIEAELSRGR
jgi:protein-disulfide isomerase